MTKLTMVVAVVGLLVLSGRAQADSPFFTAAPCVRDLG